LKVEPTIVKIDAEGLNYDVLLGAVETIERSRPFVMVEVEPEEADNARSYFENGSTGSSPMISHWIGLILLRQRRIPRPAIAIFSLF
jgi:Methyltransferase FkbM domain